MSDQTYEREDITINLRKVDIIWNITRLCGWDCGVCCVDAAQVKSDGDSIIIRDEGLSNDDRLRRVQNGGSNFDQALSHRQGQGLELTFEQKMAVLENLKGVQPKLDFSGGDPLGPSENLRILKVAAWQFGRDQITLTATGAGLGVMKPAELSPYIGELNFTYDRADVSGDSDRPRGYATGNLRKAAQFARAGVRTRGECPLSTLNCGEEQLRQLYLDLHQAQVSTLLLMRLFPSGRGALLKNHIPSVDQYRKAIAVLREMELRYGSPQLKLQCALRMLEPSSIGDDNPCDLVSESYGLMWDGTLLASPWAIGPTGTPMSSEWVRGNLAEQRLTDILTGEKVTRMTERLDENFGHCKIFAFIHGVSRTRADRMFEKTDPLYVKSQEPVAIPGIRR